MKMICVVLLVVDLLLVAASGYRLLAVKPDEVQQARDRIVARMQSELDRAQAEFESANWRMGPGASPFGAPAARAPEEGPTGARDIDFGSEDPFEVDDQGNKQQGLDDAKSSIRQLPFGGGDKD